MPDWISVEERLPVDDKIVLAWRPSEYQWMRGAWMASWSGTRWYDICEEEFEMHGVTHWQPLPDSPVHAHKENSDATR